MAGGEDVTMEMMAELDKLPPEMEIRFRPDGSFYRVDTATGKEMYTPPIEPGPGSEPGPPALPPPPAYKGKSIVAPKAKASILKRFAARGRK